MAQATPEFRREYWTRMQASRTRLHERFAQIAARRDQSQIDALDTFVRELAAVDNRMMQVAYSVERPWLKDIPDEQNGLARDLWEQEAEADPAGAWFRETQAACKKRRFELEEALERAARQSVLTYDAEVEEAQAQYAAERRQRIEWALTLLA